MTPELREAVLAGGYWAVPPGPDCAVAIAYTGAVAAEAKEAHAALLEDVPGAAALSWIGAVGGHRSHPLGVEKFGQSADIPDLYRVHGIDADAILDACARA